MKRENIIRIIVWGTLGAIALIAAISGFLSFKTGHGEIGAIIKETTPLTNIFNNLDNLKKFSDSGVVTKAKPKGNAIVVSYNTSSKGIEGSKASFSFVFDNSTGIRILTMKYNAVDKEIAQFVTRYMIDAIAVSKNYPEGKVWEKFTMDDFQTTTAKQGVNIQTSNGITTVRLNMDTSILDSNIEKSDIYNYITLEQAQKMLDGKKSGSTSYATYDNIVVRVNIYDSYYTIFMRDVEEIYSRSMYESIKSIIEFLSGETRLNEFTTICPEFDNTNYEEENSNFSIIYNSTDANQYQEFADHIKVLKINVQIDKTEEQVDEISSLEENDNISEISQQ